MKWLAVIVRQIPGSTETWRQLAPPWFRWQKQRQTLAIANRGGYAPILVEGWSGLIQTARSILIGQSTLTQIGEILRPDNADPKKWRSFSYLGY
jgi:hypothetical protein